jgi:hypothetical protein
MVYQAIIAYPNGGITSRILYAFKLLRNPPMATGEYGENYMISARQKTGFFLIRLIQAVPNPILDDRLSTMQEAWEGEGCTIVILDGTRKDWPVPLWLHP